jgi:hypothetical protein
MQDASQENKCAQLPIRFGIACAFAPRNPVKPMSDFSIATV